MSLSSAALRRPVATIAATLAVVLLGAVSLAQLPVSLLPDVTLPVLTIRTRYPGAAPAEVSRFVAQPIEEAIAATPGLVELRSASRSGEVTTTARFAWGTDMAATVLAVRERLDNARGRLPERAERPTVLTSDPGERPIAVLALTGPGDLRAIARTAEEVHARRLEQLAGVASVAVTGAPEDEVRVDVSPERLRALGLTPDDVARAIRDANAASPGGTVRRGQFRFAVRALTEFQSPGEIAEVPLGAGGARLRDVGTARLGLADPVTLVRLDGRPAVGLVVYKDAGANTVAVTREITATLRQLEAEFPDVRLTLVAAQAAFVSDALANLVQEIVLGGALSLLVILLVLRDARGALAIGLIVPLSVLVALVLLQWLGVSLNILSLGGLALGVGLLVDNAIVVTEATARHRADGMAPLDAALRACREVAAPLVAGTLTTILVFGPIVFVEGLAAALFRDLSLSVVTSLAASLVLALTVLPVLITARSARRTTLGAPASPTPLTRLGTRLADWYEHGMAWCLARPRAVAAAAVAALLVTALVVLRLPREILPAVNEGLVVASLRLPEGTSLEETTRQVARLEAAARDAGAAGLYARVGAASDEEVLAGVEPGGPNTAQLVLPAPRGDAAALAARLRAALPGLVQGALVLDLAGQSEFGALIGREGRLVRVEVGGPTLADAARAADSVRARLAALPGLADVRAGSAGAQPVVEVALERERLAQRGIGTGTVAAALAGGLGGTAAGDLRETDRRTPIRVRYDGTANEDLPATLATSVRGVSLGQLVRAEERRVASEVIRVDQRPVVPVEATVREGGTARAAAETRTLLESLPLPAGITWRVTGADDEQRRLTREFTLVALLAVALVYLVLAGEFASFTTPLLVILIVPLAAAGGLVALWLTGQSLNAVSLIGLVIMVGIADNDAVVKLDTIKRLRAEGVPLREAILRGGRLRLRAIAMTSVTTITGVLPLVLGLGAGGELYRPLAASVIGGSVSALLVTFFLLPTAYWVVERRREQGA